MTVLRTLSSDLANSGLMVLNYSRYESEQRSIVVSGVARSGTSLVAKLLAMVGVPLGAEADPVVFEDVEIAEAVNAGEKMHRQAGVKLHQG